jgi:hypothetical protein
MNVLFLTLCLVGIFTCVYLMQASVRVDGYVSEGLTLLWRALLFAGAVALFLQGLILLGVPL